MRLSPIEPGVDVRIDLAVLGGEGERGSASGLGDGKGRGQPQVRQEPPQLSVIEDGGYGHTSFTNDEAYVGVGLGRARGSLIYRIISGQCETCV